MPRGAFGDYELIEEIARGGMGVVYKARQVSLDRVVAVKMILAGEFATQQFVQRFRTEASAAAVLHHPNIVAIHEVGVHAGQHYFSMDFVAGPSLAALVGHQPLSARRAAQYLKTIAEAIHYAHEQGILHRDLKPSNVLIDANDQPRITDFGLAKRLEGETSLMLSGQMVGSPNFMPPEQATARHGKVGRYSDVYALGGILYHLLTARPPFQADSLEVIVSQVLTSEPVSPRLLNASIPRDLETICLKCLEKEPSRRYATARALADELGRFLEGKPILAHPVSMGGKAWKWCRRRPALAGMGATLVLTFGLGLVGVLWQSHQARNQRRLAQMGEYAADMKLAQQAVENNDLRLAVDYLDKHRPEAKSEVRGPKAEVDLRGWEWRYLWQRCQGDELVRLHQYPGPIRAVAVSKDGKLLAVQTAGNRAGLWDLTTRQPITEFTHGGRKALAFSPADRLLAVAGRDARGEPTVDLWDLETQKLSRALSQTSPVRSLAFSPDGSLLATFDDRGKVEVVEWSSGRIRTNLMAGPPRRGEAGVVAFSPDGNRLAVGEDYGTIRLVKWPGGGTLPIETQTSDGVSALAFSPDGKILAAGFVYHSGTIRLWDADSGQPQGQLTNAGSVISLAFSPDGERLAAASHGEPIRIWNVATRAELGRLRGDVDTLGGVAFLPDGRRLVSGSTEGWVYIWDSTAGSRTSEPAKLVISPDSVTLPPPVVNRFGIAFTPDSQRFITTDPEGSVAMWSSQPVRQIEPLPEWGANHWAVALSPDGHWLATGETSGKVHLWDWQVRRRVASLEVPFEWAGYLRFSRSSQFLSARLFFNDDTAKVRIWRSGDWQEVPLSPAQQAGMMSLDLSPDDRHLAAGYANGTVKLWSFPAGQPEATYRHRNGWVFGVCFSEDGRMLASAGQDGPVIWDVVARRALVSWRGLTGPVRSVAFSADGGRLATGGDDATQAVKLWDLATHRELLTLPAEGFFFSDVAFSPDGNTLIATSLKGIAHFWRALSWQEIEAKEMEGRPH